MTKNIEAQDSKVANLNVNSKHLALCSVSSMEIPYFCQV